MAGRWSDEHIAASLNRMGLPTGQGKTWTAHRVASVRRVRGIHAYRSAEKDGEWLTMTEAAKVLSVTNHAIRRRIKAVPTTWRRSRSKRRWPGKVARVALSTRTRFQCLQTLDEGVHNDSRIAIPRSPRSAALLERHTRPSSRNRVKLA